MVAPLTPLSPVTPGSPMLPSPRSNTATRRFWDDDFVEVAPRNPCFPSSSTQTPAQLAAMHAAVARKLAERPAKNANLTHAEQWTALTKMLGRLCEQDVLVLSGKVRSLSSTLQSLGARSDALDQRAIAEALRAVLDAVDTCNYVLSRELHKVKLNKGRRPKKLFSKETAQADEEDDKPLSEVISETLSTLRYSLTQFPQRVEEFAAYLDTLDHDGVNYDETMDKKRLGNIQGYFEDASESFENLRHLLVKQATS